MNYKNRLMSECEIHDELNDGEPDKLSVDIRRALNEIERLSAENSRLKGVLAELKDALGLVSTERECTQNGINDRGSDEYANPDDD